VELQKFREEMKTKMHDTYSVILKRKSLPMGLLNEPTKTTRMNLLQVEKFEDTFGTKQRRKRPKIAAPDLESLVETADKCNEHYVEGKDTNIKTELDYILEMKDRLFDKGQSKRIYGELHKVIDSSDVVVVVLDARDPMGTRCRYVEGFIKKKAAHKHLVFVLNKCDLVPTWVTARWVKILSAEYPTLAFHASITHPFGKGSLIHLLRQFARLHADKKNISVGFVGYPNVGKSSIINTLRGKLVCKAAPVPGETKVWQYITLFKRIFLVDCPGVVYDVGDSNTDSILKGVVRVENVKDTMDHIGEVLKRVKKEYITRTYKIEQWSDSEDFLTQFANQSGRLLKKGEPDMNTCARMILNDWQRGKLPWFVPPPDLPRSDESDPIATIDPAAVSTDATAAAEGTVKGAAKVPLVNFVAQQKLSKLKVATEFVGEDAQAPGQGLDAEGNEQEEVDWDEVFKNIHAKTGLATAAQGGDGDKTPDVFSDGPDSTDVESIQDPLTNDEEEGTEADSSIGRAGVESEETATAGGEEETSQAHTEDEEKPEEEVEGGEVKKGRRRRGGKANATSVFKKTRDDSKVLLRLHREGLSAVATALSQQMKDKSKEKKEEAATAKSAEDKDAKKIGKKRKRDDADEDGETKKAAKEVRMTTNKMKIGDHYYKEHNVKNKRHRRKENGGNK